MTSTFATCRYATAALRAQPKPAAELLSQLLFGEPVSLLQQVGRYARVRCSDDGLTGFVRLDQLLEVSEQDYRRQHEQPAFNLDLFAVLLGDRSGLPITFGARLPHFDGLRSRHDGRGFTYTGQAAQSRDLPPSAELLIRLARKWLFVPGMRGGRTPAGVDGAALVQLICRIIGVRLPRFAKAMVHEGRPVDFMQLAQAGDLAFFDNPRRTVDHVGILLPDSTILHVHDRVRIDAVDHYGIFNYERKQYTHRLRLVKRHFADAQVQGVLQSKEERLRDVAQNQLAIF